MRQMFYLVALLTMQLRPGMHCAAAASEMVDPLKAPPLRGFVSFSRATSWEEALISGNGTIGALLMSRPLNEIITFTHERLFMPWDDSQPVVHMAPHLETVRQMIEEGAYRGAAEFVSQLARNEGHRISIPKKRLVSEANRKLDAALALFSRLRHSLVRSDFKTLRDCLEKTIDKVVVKVSKTKQGRRHRYQLLGGEIHPQVSSLYCTNRWTHM